MATVVTRSGKGSALTWAELDANFNNLNAGANYATSAGYQAPTGNSNDWVQAFQQTPAHYESHREMSAGGPAGTWWFAQNFRHSNSGGYWGTQLAWGWEDNANKLYQRNISNNSWSGWVRYVNSNNFSLSGTTLTISI